MDTNNLNTFTRINTRERAAVDANQFLKNVFAWMGIALAITAVVAYYFASNEQLIGLLINESGMSILGWVVMLAPLGFVIAISSGYQRFSTGTLTILFGLYAVLMGMSLSFILLIYTASSVFQTFAITAGMFGFMAFLGYTTKTDLSKLGSILLMGLVGIIIASVVNWFLKSNSLDYIISFIGVVIFTGLTAYDMQKLKNLSRSLSADNKDIGKLTIMGALTLYLDFVNLFLFLLRFFGNRR